MEGGEGAGLQRGADLLHQGIIKVEIVHDCQPHSQDLVALEEMTDIRPTEILANRAIAGRVDGKLVPLVFCVADIPDALGGKEVTVAGVSAGHNTVEKVHPQTDCLQNISGGTNTHQIPGLFCRHIGLDRGNDPVHLLLRLAHSKAADGVSVQVQLADLLHMADPQVGKGATLIDSEQKLVGINGIREGLQSLHLLLAANQPAGGPLAGSLGVFPGGGIGHAFVKGHGNGGAEVGLDPHTILRGHKDPFAVYVGGKLHSFLRDAPKHRQREDLEAAAVGEDGTIPVHKLMQSSHIPDYLIAGTDMEVIGIAKLHLAVQLLQIQGGNTALDGGGGSHIHKSGSLDGSVDGFKYAPAGGTFCFCYLKHSEKTGYTGRTPCTRSP